MSRHRILPWAWVAIVGSAFLTGTAIDLPADLAAGDVQVLGLVTGTHFAFSFPIAGAIVLTITSVPGDGTTIAGEIPVAATSEVTA